MAIIFSYPTLSNLKAEDLLLVSDVSAEGKPTKNITVQQIVDLIPSIVPGGGTVSSVTLDFQNTGLTTGGAQTQEITSSGTFGIAGTLAQGAGGTGIDTYSTGELLYTDSNSILQKLTPGVDGTILTLASGVPSWAAAASSGVTSIASTSSLTGMTLTSSPNPIIATGTITLGGKLKTEYGGTWDGTTAVWTTQLGLNYLTGAGSASLNQVLSIDSSGNAVFATPSAGVTSWSGGNTGLVSSGGDPATGAVVLGVGSKLVSNNGGTGYSNSDLQGGDMLFKGPSVLSRLEIGTVGHVLTVNASNEPEWTAVPGGVGGSGTNGRAARWTSSTNLANSAFFDDGAKVALGVSPVANQHFTIDSSLYSTSIKILNKNSAVGHTGVNATVGQFYTGAQDIIGLQGSTIGSSSGTRQGGLFTSTTDTAGLNIGITASASNGGTGSHFAARFQDGTEAVDKYWKCVSADGDGQWATINDADTTYELKVAAQGASAFATLNLDANTGTDTAVKFEANNAAETNSDITVYGNDATPSVAYAHKDIFTDASGTAGQYVGIKNITVSSSGHITSAESEKFVGQRPTGPGKETAGFQGDSGAEVLLLPFSSTLSGKPGQFNFTIINNAGAAASGVTLKVALYTGLLGDTVSAANVLVTQGGTANIGSSLTPPFKKGADVNDNFEAAYSSGLAMDGNYILAIQIPEFIRLLSISQDGDQKAGGCLATSLDLASAPANLNGVGVTARVAGSPIKIPAWDLTDPVVS